MQGEADGVIQSRGWEGQGDLHLLADTKKGGTLEQEGCSRRRK